MKCPTGKRCFKDKIAALWALGRTGGEILPGEKTERRVYGDCKCCPWWHLTSMEEPMKPIRTVELRISGNESDAEEALTKLETVFTLKKKPSRWYQNRSTGLGSIFVRVVLNPEDMLPDKPVPDPG